MTLLTALLAATLLPAPALAQAGPEVRSEVRERGAEAEDTEEDEAGGAKQFEAEFGEHLMLPSDMMLQGLMAYETLTFTAPATWELTADPVLELRFEHSPQLLEDRSSLTVRLNERAVTSIELDRDNAVGGAARIALPRELLDDYNKLTLLVTQHVTDECEDPFDPSLWTRISRDSLIRFTYTDLPVSGELLDYPFPIYDPLGYGPAELTLVSPVSELSPATVRALGVVGLSLGRLVGYHTVRVNPPVKRLAEAKTHALVIGTPAENPMVEQLVEQRSLAAGEGLVATLTHPSDPALAVLVVTGRDEAGLLKAASALAGNDRYPVLSGRSSRVRLAETDTPPPSRRVPRPAPARDRFTLDDLGIPDQTVRGFYAPPIRVPLTLEGDAVPRLDGSRLELHYGYSAQLDTRLSTMEVRMNGVVLHSVALDDEDGEQDARLVVQLPQAVLEPANELEIIFHLFPVDFDPCRRVSDRMIWGTVFDSSEFTVRRDRYAMVPDLGLLKYGLWPFTLEPERGATAVILGDKPGRGDAAAALQLAAELGRLSPWDAPEFELLTAAPGRLDELSDRHAVLLVGESAHSSYDALVEAGALTLSGDEERTLGQPPVQEASAETGYGTLEELLHPAGTDRAVLVMRARRSVDLLEMAYDLRDVRKLLSLAAPDGEQGPNVAVFGPDEQIRTVSVAEQRQLGAIPLSSKVSQGLRRSWWMIGLLVMLAAVLLAAIGRAWAALKGGRT